MNTSLQWFRLYHRIIDDEKIRLLAFEDRWHFVALCCLKADGLLNEPDAPLKERKIAVKMGVQARELDEIKRRLLEVGLIDENMQPTAWEDLQYRSDNSTDRVRKFREKTKTKRAKREGNVSVTGQDTDTDTDTEKETPNGVSSKRGSRLPEDWTPDEVFARTEGLSANAIVREAAKFRDYWRSMPGQKGVRQDWQATWRNWIRKAAVYHPAQKSEHQSREDREWKRREAEIYRNVL